jgi:hypothetical protein
VRARQSLVELLLLQLVQLGFELVLVQLRRWIEQ